MSNNTTTTKETITTSADLANVSKPKPKQKTKAIIYQSNDIAKNEYSFSQFVNKIKKDSDSCYISLAFHKLTDSDKYERSMYEVREIPYTSLINHFLPLYNSFQKFPLREEKTTWFTFGKFLQFIAKLKTEKYNEVLNFSLQYKPKN